MMDRAAIYTAEFNRRFRVYNYILDRPEIVPKMWLYYKHNCKAFINDWCITFDPRNRDPIPKVLPFMLFPRQEKFVDYILGCYNDKESGLCEKARDMGATWLCVCIAVWLWLFWDGTIIGFGSRKEEYVDKKGDPKAIFPKIRQLISYLPWFLKPEGYDEDKHATYMRIVHPSNGSAITGEAGSAIGRGGRTSIYFKDESAHYEQAEEIEAALGDNTDVQIDISSVNGSANIFYRRRLAGVVWHPDSPPIEKGKIRIFIMDWRDNPLKNQAWYDLRRNRAEAEGLLHIFAQEVDRNYAGAVDRIIIHPEWINAAVDAHKALGISVRGEKIAAQDVADGGGDKNALAIRHDVVLRYIEAWGGEAGESAKRAVPTCVEYGVRELYYDSIGVGAGFKEAINSMKDRRDEKGQPTFPNILVMPWSAGASPLDPTDNIIYGDPQSPTNEEQYANLKAQAWFRVRARFYKTFRAVRHGEQFPHSDLISLDSTMPRLHELKMELSQPVHKTQTNGKTIVDKKPEGASSPNLADALIMCFNPTREISILDCID